MKLSKELIGLLPELHAGEADGVEEEEGDGRHQVQVGHVLVVHTVHRTALIELNNKGTVSCKFNFYMHLSNFQLL
jgi:hypothetical protein